MCRVGIRLLVLAITMMLVLATVASTAAADTVSGRLVAPVLVKDVWPKFQTKFAGTPVAELEITKARCPRRVSTETGTRFTCTAVIDGQRAKFNGRIRKDGSPFFNLGSLILFPDRLEAATEQAYQEQRGSAGAATCANRTVVIAAPGPSGAVDCQVADASGTTSTATITLDENANVTDITFAP